MKDDIELVVPKPEWVVKQEIRDLIDSKDGGKDILKLYDDDPDLWRVRKREAKVARMEFQESSSTGETRLTLGGGSNLRCDIEAVLYGDGGHELAAPAEAEQAKRARSYTREEIQKIVAKATELHDNDGVKWEDIAKQFNLGATTLYEWRKEAGKQRK